MKKIALLGLATAAMLAGCSNDELVYVNQANLDEISFVTFVNKTTSRATDITNSNIGDFANGFSVYGYTLNSEDTDWSTLFDDEHIEGAGVDEEGNWTYDKIQYWKEGNNYHFHAIAPFGDDAATDVAASKRHWTNTVAADNKAQTTIHFDNIVKDGDTYTAAGEQDLVYGYKPATGLAKDNPKVDFTLSHLLSRVKFRIVGDDNNPKSVRVSLTDATITDTYSQGDITITNSQASTKETLAASPWTLNLSDKASLSFGQGLNIISTSPGYVNSVETTHKYVIPDISNSVSYNAALSFKLEADVNNNNKYQTYKVVKNVVLPEVQMKKGHSYVYEIKINVTANTTDNNLIEPIAFNVYEVIDWDDYEVLSLKLGNIEDPSKVQLYDYAMSDGSFVHLEEGESLTTAQKDACIGIVFWTPKNEEGYLTLSDDAALMQDYPDCTHGLIVSTKYITGPGGVVDDMGINRYKWQGTGYNDFDVDVDIWATFQKDHEIYGSSPYTSIQCNFEDEGLSDEYYAEASARLNTMLGYNNTAVLCAYNNANPTSPIEMISAFQNDLETGILVNYEGYSSWYIPSPIELWFLGAGDVEEAGTEVMDNVNLALQKLNESSYDIIQYYPHWSSTECNYRTAVSAWLYQETNVFRLTIGYKFFPYPIRPVCAF